MLHEPSTSRLRETCTEPRASNPPNDDSPPLLLEVSLLHHRGRVFVGKEVGHRMVATAILQMIHLDLGIHRLIAKGFMPPGEPVPPPILTAWLARGLHDASARDGAPYFVGPVDCYRTFLSAVLALRGGEKDRELIARTLEKCRAFTFEGLVADWRAKLDHVKCLEDIDADDVNAA